MANSNGTATLRQPKLSQLAPGQQPGPGQPVLDPPLPSQTIPVQPLSGHTLPSQTLAGQTLPSQTLPVQPKNIQFTHFGLLNDGEQSKTSMLTSLTLNVAVALVIIIVGAATKKVHDDNVKLTALIAPVPIKQEVKPPEPKIKLPPPPKLPPVVKELEPPKITVPDVKVPDTPRPDVVHMDTPKPIITPSAPVRVVAPPAPQIVSLARVAPASVPNSDAKPSAVRLGNPDSPIRSTNGPAAASVNLARGASNMSASNTGNGPAAAKVQMGSGSPNGTAMKGPMGPVAVQGLAHGTPAGTGTTRGGGAQQVALAQPPAAVALPRPVAASSPSPKSAIKVLYKPRPVYTAEAIQLHLEGNVSVRINVSPSGVITVLGVNNGLGHGLDEAARNAVAGMKVQPALDAAGQAVAWDGVVVVSFQLAGS